MKCNIESSMLMCDELSINACKEDMEGKAPTH